MKRTATIVNDINKMFPAKRPLAIANADGIRVSAEDVTLEGQPVADYYGEFRGGYPWIDPKLEAYAEQNGLTLDWENPGCVEVYHG